MFEIPLPQRKICGGSKTILKPRRLHRKVNRNGAQEFVEVLFERRGFCSLAGANSEREGAAGSGAMSPRRKTKTEQGAQAGWSSRTRLAIRALRGDVAVTEINAASPKPALRNAPTQ